MFDLTVAGLPPTAVESDERLSRSAKDAERWRIMFVVNGPVDDPCVAAAVPTGRHRQSVLLVLLLLVLLVLLPLLWVVMMSLVRRLLASLPVSHLLVFAAAG
jgi:hypothetical protein